MNRRYWMALPLAALILGGCESSKELLGMEKQAPDEFAVYTRAPLSLPPQYGLRPPEPGKQRPQADNPTVSARDAILGSAKRTPPPAPGQTPGIQALLSKVEADKALPDIRNIVNRETATLAVEDMSMSEKIMFWGTPNEYGTIVDAKKETRRIQENQALGQTLTKGTVPTIERKRKAILEGFFD